MNKIQQYKEILEQAPEGATHYHVIMRIYYKFEQAMGMADAYLCGKWEDYPLYPSISALSDLQTIVDQHETIERLKARVADLESQEMLNDLKALSNARRLIKANKRTSNGRLVMELFGTGMGTARDYARKLNLDPDSNETPFDALTPPEGK